jgi:hypothetical protein
LEVAQRHPRGRQSRSFHPHAYADTRCGIHQHTPPRARRHSAHHCTAQTGKAPALVADIKAMLERLTGSPPRGDMWSMRATLRRTAGATAISCCAVNRHSAGRDPCDNLAHVPVVPSPCVTRVRLRERGRADDGRRRRPRSRLRNWRARLPWAWLWRHRRHACPAAGRPPTQRAGRRPR